MRKISTAYQDHLDSKVTTTCWCWRIVRVDGFTLGFTNHDRDLTFDGLVYQANSGMSGSEIEESLGLTVDNMTIESAVTSDEISEDDIAAGDYDHAIVDIFSVNWNDVSQRVLLKCGRLGDIERGRVGFIGELRGFAADLQQPTGRLFQFTCDAVVGDERCGVNLDQPAFKTTGIVQRTDDPRWAFTAQLVGDFERGWFDGGVLTWTSGNNSGRRSEIRSDTGSRSIALWAEMPKDIEDGDSFSLTAGCDKTFATCRAKFSNAVEFRGFPHIPEDDFIIQYPNRGDTGLDGGGNFRED